MPQPSNDPINSKDPKYGNGSKSVKAPMDNKPFAGRVFTTLDCFKQKDQTLKRTCKIESELYKKRTMVNEKNNPDGTTKRREW
jgi:hypothetical protein